jgi:hypothetical protein
MDRQWVEDVVDVLIEEGGKAQLSRIVKRIVEKREGLPRTVRETVSNVLQSYSSDSRSYNGRHDLFYSVEGIGRGWWGLRGYPKRPDLSFLRNPNEEGLQREMVRIVGDNLRRKGAKGRRADLNKQARSLLETDPALRARAMAVARKIVENRTSLELVF